jgi:hypothetical protein
MEFSAGFTLIGEDQSEDPDELAPAAPATVFPIDQDIYQEGADPWSKGDLVGEAHGFAVVTRRGAMTNVTFAFDEADSVVVHGLLPVEGKRLGNGRIAVTGGTGKFAKASGNVDMQTRNPKRWSFVL